MTDTERQYLRFQFTPVVRRATLPQPHLERPRVVSIHARRATGDRRAGGASGRMTVSIHARRATGDDERGRMFLPFAVSIHARRATGDIPCRQQILRRNKVSIHARRATGDQCGCACQRRGRVSIHARRATGDDFTDWVDAMDAAFQFTPVVRRATARRSFLRRCRRRFNSRPSCDGRRPLTSR